MTILTAGFGWECDDINNDNVGITVPILNPITLRGYQFSLSVMAIIKPGFLNPGEYTEVLFVAQFLFPQRQDFGATSFIQSNKGLHHSLHGGIGTGGTGAICQAILKSYVARDPIGNAVNETITANNLDIKVSAGTTLKMFASHAGEGPVDFECQGTLFYEAL
jgi:hypothetical protein